MSGGMEMRRRLHELLGVATLLTTVTVLLQLNGGLVRGQALSPTAWGHPNLGRESSASTAVNPVGPRVSCQNLSIEAHPLVRYSGGKQRIVANGLVTRSMAVEKGPKNTLQ